MKANEQGSRLRLCNFHSVTHRRNNLPSRVLLTESWTSRLATMGRWYSSSPVRSSGPCDIGVDWLDNVDNTATRSTRAGTNSRRIQTSKLAPKRSTKKQTLEIDEQSLSKEVCSKRFSLNDALSRINLDSGFSYPVGSGLAIDRCLSHLLNLNYTFHSSARGQRLHQNNPVDKIFF